MFVFATAFIIIIMIVTRLVRVNPNTFGSGFIMARHVSSTNAKNTLSSVTRHPNTAFNHLPAVISAVVVITTAFVISVSNLTTVLRYCGVSC